MDVHVTTTQEQQPLLENALASSVPALLPHKTPKTPAQRTMKKAFKNTANLSKLLPTGTVLTFQTLSPLFTRQGQCHTTGCKSMTTCLLALCSISCFFLSFTDSCRDEKGKVRYGVASLRGLWVVDASIRVSAEEAEKYRLRFIDFFHAFLSILVFLAIALFDESVVSCLFPKPSKEDKEILLALPIGIGIVCSLLFVAFPSQRHGIGFPLSRN